MWYKIIDQHLEIKIFAKPHAKKTALLECSSQGLHIALHAKPHEGEANLELLTFLAKLLKTSKSKILLKRGGSSRFKWIVVPMNSTSLSLIENPESFILSS